MTLVQRFAEHQATSRLLHPSLLTNDVLKVRAKLYGVGAVIVCCLSMLISLPFFTQGQPLLGVLAIAFGFLGACSLLVIRFLGNMSIATHVLCMALWGTTVSGYLVLGGVSSHMNKWLLLMPMLGVFSGQRTTGWGWLVIAAITPVGFHLMIEHGLIHSTLMISEAEFRQMDLVNSVLFVAAMSLFVFIIHAHHVWVITQLEDRERGIRANNAELLVARDTAVRANQARDRFLANMSHELRTPLNAILGYSEIIQEELHDVHIMEHDPDFAQIKHSTDSLLTMLHDILELTKFETSQVELPTELVDLMALVELLASQQNRPVSIQMHEAWQELVIETHRATFSSLLEKVLDNACKFAQVEDHVGVVCHARDPDTQTYRIEIVDEGPGIDLKDQERIWDAFSQVDASVTRERDGAGLGLSLVRHFASNLDVHITLQSLPGEGTRVGIVIPDSCIHARAVETHSLLTT